MSLRKSTNRHQAPLGNFPVQDTFSRLYVDIFGPLPTTKEGYKYILFVIDSFSGWPEAFPMSCTTGTAIAKTLYNEVFARYGAPYSLVSDRGQNFLSKVVTELCEFFQVEKSATSSFHPMSNGTVERRNSTIAQILRAFINKDQTNWAELLPSALMTMRASPSYTSDFSPHHILFGKEMPLPFDNSLIPKKNINKEASDYIAETMKHLKVVKRIATENTIKTRRKTKERYDKNSTEPTFALRDQVMVHNKVVGKGLSPKFANQYDGPYYIVDVGPKRTYKLRRVSDDKEVKSQIHADRLKLYHKPCFQPCFDPPPPDGSIRDNHIAPRLRTPVQNPDPEPPDDINDHAIVPDPDLNDSDIPEQVDSDSDSDSETEQPVSPDDSRPVSPEPLDTNNDSQDDTQSLPKLIKRLPRPKRKVKMTTQSKQASSQPGSQSDTTDNADEIYYIEKLIKYRVRNGEKEFFVKWVDHPEKTWQKASEIPAHLIRNFHIMKTQTGKRRKKTKANKRVCFKT